MNWTRRRAGAALLASPWVCASGARAQDSYPSRPIRMILPYTTGGSAYALARAIADHMQSSLGQPAVVDSRPGANSMLGASLAAQAPKDGYTILYLGWPTISTNVVTYKNPPFRLEDFQPITTFYRSPLWFTVRQDMPASNFKELLDYGRRQGVLSFGTSGNGSSPHLLLMRMKEATGVNFQHVPYKGEGPAVQDVLGGHLTMFGGSIATPLELVRAGRLKVIASSMDERLPAFPDVGTFREAGFGDYVFTYWHGMAAPAGTPRAVIDKLHAALAAAMASPSVRAALSPDQIPSVISPDEFTALIHQDIQTWGPVIRANNLTE